ncbi:MAG TPA: HIRAN domain-containing protein, partial [Thiobacillaceae bacterium]|nr:HIRAN domain-containing protein [Thiobacillaceae bacterium]
MTYLKRLSITVLLGFALQFAAVAFADTETYILLQDSPLAGFQFHEGKALRSEMKEGDALTLAREPDNQYDPKAIRVEWRGHKLGYVPRRENLDLARLMDNGQQLRARITRMQQARNPWER